MSETPLETLVPQIEIALEEGDLDTAAKLLAAGSERHGKAPELLRLSRRLHEVRRLARQPTIDSLVQRSQERIRAADYAGALEPLRQATALAPADEALAALLTQTEKAAARHAAAVERQSALSSAVREIESLVSERALDVARDRLEQARSEHGRKKVFDDLEAKISEVLREQQLKTALEHLERAKELRAGGDWHGTFHQADQALTLRPDLVDAQRLKEEARLRIEQLEGRRRLHETVEAGARDVERLVEAGELKRAEARLVEATDQLGRHELFDALARRIDDAKKRLDVKRRSEWAERRANEAESLVQEAARLAVGGKLDEALGKLAAARHLDPAYPELEARERDYRAARDRQRAQEERRRAAAEAGRRVAAALDGLRLDEAAHLLRQARGEFDDPKRWQALEERLAGLRQAEEAVGELPTPERLKRYGIAVREAIRTRERTVAAAYSWKQAMLYPVRGPLLTAICVGLSALLGWGGLALPILPWLMLPLALLLAPALISHTLQGKNQPPGPGELFGSGSLPSALALGSLVLTAGLPVVLLWILGRPALPSAVLWPATALGLFGLCLVLVPASGVASAFGPRRAWSLGKHLAALAKDPPSGAETWLVADLVFLVAVAVPLLRVTLASLAPALGIPLVALVEGYALVLLPHLVGVTVRGRRLDWAEAYA